MTMHTLFGVSLILYMLKLSAGQGFIDLYFGNSVRVIKDNGNQQAKVILFLNSTIKRNAVNPNTAPSFLNLQF